MTASGLGPSGDTQWKVLYRAAMFERDREILQSLLDGAEGAVIARGRELLYTTGYNTEEEREALEDALCILRAYRNASRLGNAT